jgi:DNA gyrase subunit A
MFDMETLKEVLLENELQSSYLDYAMSVIIGRAIPDARDGLKPVQRRIIYAMYSIKNTHDQPTKKSARIVGEVIGKFHPHGDISVYDSLVRMAQPFSMNHTLAEGQGNFGSVDGDPPAAMRYTEVRLTKMAEEMIEEINKETVDFSPNFDNTETEPVVLPGKIPNLLINGSYGIAVGVSTSMPPHNLNEVCDAIVHVIDNKETNVDEIMQIITGPDFPTGGTAVISNNTYNGYRFGKGQVTVRGEVHHDSKLGKIVITEIPYGVNKATLVENIALLVKDKNIFGISDLRDESDREGLRIVLDLKKDADADSIIKILYKHTQLEITFPIINLAVIGNSLKTFNIIQLLNTFIDYRRGIIKKRSQYELTVAKDRAHIVDGLLITIEKIDEIVTLIKKSKEVKEAREALQNKYSLSEKQANAILDMKLSRLTHLEFDSLEKEKIELGEKIAYYSGVLEDSSKVDGIIKKETLEIKRMFGRERRTKIIKSENTEDVADEETIINQKVAVIITNSGYVKRLDINNYKEQGRGGRGIVMINLKEKDYVKQMLTTYTRDTIMCVSDKGRIYWLKVYKIPEGGRYSEGKAIVNLLNIKDERIIKIFSITKLENSDFVFLTKKGIIKKTKASLFSHPRTVGVRALNIKEGDEVVDAITYSGNKYIIIITKKGKIIKFSEAVIREIGRSGMGIRGIKLKEGDTALKVITGDDEGYVLSVTEKGYGKLTNINKYRLQKRGGGGTINIKTGEKTGNVAKSEFVKRLDSNSVVLINSEGVAITFALKAVRITGRAAKGVRLMRLTGGSTIVDIQIIDNTNADITTAITAEAPAS